MTQVNRNGLVFCPDQEVAAVNHCGRGGRGMSNSVGGLAVPGTAQPANRVEPIGHQVPLRIDQSVVHMHVDDAADHQVRSARPGAQLNRLMQRTFHRRGNTVHAGRRDTNTVSLAQFANLELIDFRSEFCRRRVHLVGQRFGDEVDDKFTTGMNIGQRVFRFSVRSVGRTEHHQRRIGTNTVEETERGQVGDSAGRNGRHPGDRSRRDQADHPPIDIACSHLFWIKLHNNLSTLDVRSISHADRSDNRPTRVWCTGAVEETRNRGFQSSTGEPSYAVNTAPASRAMTIPAAASQAATLVAQ